MISDSAQYKILNKLHVSDSKNLIIFSSSGNDGEWIDDLLGKEVFLFDYDTPIWQIDAPKGSRHIFDESENKFVDEPYEWNFCSIYKKDEKYLAERFDGYVFELDMQTGKATYLYWTK